MRWLIGEQDLGRWMHPFFDFDVEVFDNNERPTTRLVHRANGFALSDFSFDLRFGSR
jgi:hypothetical protein